MRKTLTVTLVYALVLIASCAYHKDAKAELIEVCELRGRVIEAVAILRDIGVQQKNVRAEFTSRGAHEITLLTVDLLTPAIYHATNLTPTYLYKLAITKCLEE